MAAVVFNKLEQRMQDSLDHSIQLLQNALSSDTQYPDLSERLQVLRPGMINNMIYKFVFLMSYLLNKFSAIFMHSHNINNI